MLAFAANSIFNRLALLEDAIGPGGFASIRVATGVAVLLILVASRAHRVPRPTKPDVWAVAGLTAYMLGFSFAYVSMDAGLGALILFGGVQITMFLGSLIEGDTPPGKRWAGMLLALAGLAILTVPSGPVILPAGAILLMAGAAIGWGIYSLAGRKATDPIASTCWNFSYCLPLVLIATLLWPDETQTSMYGIALAMLSGGVTSAMGYALWYSLLPMLGATRGALAQLSAPAIALGLGAAFLGEQVTMSAILATAMILGGIAFGLVPSRRREA